MSYKNYLNKKAYLLATLNEHSFKVIRCDDQSGDHAGHAGHGIESHFYIELQHSFDSAKERLEAHKKVLSLFADDIPQGIHALSIRFIP
ncbi:BolA/IbaG family iron-sulfur metabolism protein [bacterium]|jgi:stress-induced morphogen|nr:BolA/IbaG family iron-sulfur metabolism protein [bacterium]NBX72092.1 BolA/IbaG family iron-sulfur metabolism protein [bacterium]